MWFKTRQGLVSLLEPLEIGVTKYDAGQSGAARWPDHHSVWVQHFTRQFHYKGILGTASGSDKRWQHVAKFQITESSGAAIAHCMTLIEEAIAAKAHICDLSTIGDANAWSSNNYLVEWKQHDE